MWSGGKRGRTSPKRGHLSVASVEDSRQLSRGYLSRNMSQNSNSILKVVSRTFNVFFQGPPQISPMLILADSR